MGVTAQSRRDRGSLPLPLPFTLNGIRVQGRQRQEVRRSKWVLCGPCSDDCHPSLLPAALNAVMLGLPLSGPPAPSPSQPGSASELSRTLPLSPQGFASFTCSPGALWSNTELGGAMSCVSLSAPICPTTVVTPFSGPLGFGISPGYILNMRHKPSCPGIPWSISMSSYYLPLPFALQEGFNKKSFCKCVWTFFFCSPSLSELIPTS